MRVLFLAAMAGYALASTCADDASTCADGTFKDTAKDGVTVATFQDDCCTACTAVENAADDAVLTCTDATDSDVTACADGFWYHAAHNRRRALGHGATAAQCDACTPIDNMTPETTYTCTSASDSVVVSGGCADGFWLHPGHPDRRRMIGHGNPLDQCDPCTAVENAADDAVLTCPLGAAVSRVTACAEGFTKVAGSDDATADTCVADSTDGDDTTTTDGEDTTTTDGEDTTTTDGEDTTDGADTNADEPAADDSAAVMFAAGAAVLAFL